MPALCRACRIPLHKSSKLSAREVKRVEKILRLPAVALPCLERASVAVSQNQSGSERPAQDAPKKAEPEAAKKFEPWDVEGDHGPTKMVEFDTDEGTWMSCDVSPDGRLLVFDLLGDIYVMPVAGGEARLVSGGVSWEVQPRWSPDGKWIAFTSDRDGGDNIWVADAEGKNRRQVTKETTRLLNTPAWTPDGQYLLARKHWTDTRSAGAGEIWMYHVNGGGKGVQLTEKPNWTANIGEPVVEPKGRFLYFVASGRLRLQQERLRQHLLDRALRLAEGAPLRLRARRGRRDPPGGLARRETPLLHPPRRPEDGALHARDRDGARVAGLRPAHARPAGDVGDLRHLPRLRVDARFEVRRHHGAGQVRPRQRRKQAGDADPLQGARRAEGERGGALARQGRARAGARAAPALGRAQRRARRLQRARQDLREGGRGRAAPAPEFEVPRIRAALQRRRQAHHVRHLERRREGRRVDGERGRDEPDEDHDRARPVRQPRLLARRVEDRLPQGARQRLPRGEPGERVEFRDSLLGRARAQLRDGLAEPRAEPADARPQLRPGGRAHLLHGGGRRPRADADRARAVHHLPVERQARRRRLQAPHRGRLRHRDHPLARPQVDRLPRAAQALRRAVPADRQDRQAQLDGDERPRPSRLAAGGQLARVVARLEVRAVDARRELLRAESGEHQQGARQGREACGSARDRHRLRLRDGASARAGRPRERAPRHHARRRGDREGNHPRRRQPHQGGRRAASDTFRREADRHVGQDHRARPRGRARAHGLRHARHHPRTPVALLGQPRLRRDDDARPFRRDAERLRAERDGQGGRDDRAARLLHRLHPLRRGEPREVGRQLLRRRARPPRTPEGGRRVLRQELQPAAPRPAPAHHPGRARPPR